MSFLFDGGEARESDFINLALLFEADEFSLWVEGVSEGGRHLKMEGRTSVMGLSDMNSMGKDFSEVLWRTRTC